MPGEPEIIIFPGAQLSTLKIYLGGHQFIFSVVIIISDVFLGRISKHNTGSGKTKQ